MDLKTVKDSNIIEAAKFAKSNALSQQLPTFAGWVDDVLRHKKRIISEVKRKHWKTTHVHGIKLPHSVEEALLLDKKTNTDSWAKAITKENSRVNASWHAPHRLTPEEVRAGKTKEMIG